MRAEVVSVGTELLLGQIVDTNAAYLGRALSEVGVAVYHRTTVGDNRARLVAALREALDAADVVFTIGGLGPTQDDITRDALSEATGIPLALNEGIARELQEFLRARGAEILNSQLRQAYVPVRGWHLPNPNGTAPGLVFELPSKLAIALPGPPGEFIPMLEHAALPILRQRTGTATIRSRVLRVCGMGEAAVEDRVLDLMASDNPTVAPYAKTGEVHLRVTARGDNGEEADALAAPIIAEIQRRLGDHLYAYDDEPLEAAVVRALIERRQTVATAESCTGGMLAGRITDVPGSSAAFPGGVVAYSNGLKVAMLGVRDETLRSHGAVSREVAMAMASGVRERVGADYGIGITGVAGPDGGSEDKPVGLVYIALADPDAVDVTENRYRGIRSDVRLRATQTALTMLRDRLLLSA
ncbi:MAG: competence/damage-inducible protein A [Chthonomonadales bacterium]|nr:competence/damage-inducible protein A [Chthonomonadales bacterium]